MIHRVVLNEDRVAVLNRKFREGDILVLTDDTGERTFIIGIKATLCEDCPLGMRFKDGVECRMLFHYKQKGPYGCFPCCVDFLDGYDMSGPYSSSYPISYKQIDSLLESL